MEINLILRIKTKFLLHATYLYELQNNFCMVMVQRNLKVYTHNKKQPLCKLDKDGILSNSALKEKANNKLLNKRT